MKFLPYIGSHINENEKNVKISIFKISKIHQNVFLRGLLRYISAAIWRRSSLIYFKSYFLKTDCKCTSPNDLATRNDLKWHKGKGALKCSHTTHEKPQSKFLSVSLHDCLFPDNEVFGLPMGHNGDFFGGGGVVKNGKFKVSKQLNVVCENHWKENSGRV